MNKLKFAIAGYGKMGKIREKTIRDSFHAELTHIFDISKEFEELNHSKKCDSFDEILDSDVDAIIVSTTVRSAPEYVISALKKGKHVLCEKPPAINAEKLLEVMDVEKKSNKVLKYGFNHRFHYSVLEAKKKILDGALGKVLWMRGVYGKAGSIDFHKNWRNYKKFSGGGILIDQGIHMLDLFRFLSEDEFDCIHSILSTSFWDIECEDNAFITLQSKKGTIATLHSSATQWKHKFLLEICLENGYLTLDGILSSTGSYSPEKLIVGMREFEDITFAMGKPREIVTYFENDNSWKLELEEFISAIKKKGSIDNGTSEDALKIMQLTDQIYSNFDK